MSPSRNTRFLLVLLILVAAAGGLGLFLAFGPPGLYAKAESPDFCGSCHVLQPEYEAWFHSGAHARNKCVDCHLPNDNFASHLLWKAVDGVKDAAKFHTGLVSETIHISARGAAVVQANCQRCHAEVISRVSIDRQCWDCHRRFSHRLTGTIQTWTP